MQAVDFVQEKRAAGSDGKQPFGLPRCVGIGPFGVTEELVFEQVLGNRAAVDRHERPGLAWTAVVHGVRKELLAGARLAKNQDRRLGRRKDRDFLESLDEFRTVPD